MISLNKTILLFILSLLSLTSKAQEYLFDVQELNIKDGLPHRTVLDIVQDKEGFIWVSTIGAISRYDGHRFKTYDASFLGLSGGKWINIAVDKDNQIWFSEKIDINNINGKGGILNHQKDTIYSFENYSNNLFLTEDILSIGKSSTKKTEFFITTKKGYVYKYRDTLQLIFTFPDKINLRARCDEAPNGDYWITQHGTVFQVRNQQILQSFSTGEELYVIKQFSPNPIFQNSEYPYTYHELSNGKLLPYALPNTQTDHVSSIIHFGENFNFFTTDNFQKLVIQDKLGNFHHRYNKQGSKGFLHKFEYQNVFVDKQDILWVAMMNGLFKIVQKKNPFEISFKNSSIRGIYLDEDKQWIGGYKGSLFPNTKLTGKRWDMVDKIIITQFNKDEQEHLWIGTTSTWLAEYLPEQNEQRLYFLKERLYLYYPFYNKTKDQLWIGTNNGLVHFDRLSKKIEPIPLSIPSENVEIRQIYENKEGIWLISSKGLFLVNPSTREELQHYSTTNILPHNNLKYLHEDEAGIFWLASKGGGLIKWNRLTNTVQQFKQENGLSNNVIYAVYEDDYNNLWLPSNYGLMSFDKMTSNAKVYLPQNGIAHEEFNTFGHFQAADGTLYFGGLDGITKFHPKDLQTQQPDDVPLYITKVQTLSQDENEFVDKTKEYRNTQQIDLNVDYQILEIELSLLDYESTQDNQYAYQIEGHQNQWIYTKDKKISIINLPYGDYTITFKARGASGLWTTELLRIPLKIAAPFYLQSWFLFAMLILMILLVYAIIKWREIQFQKDKERLETEVKKRTREIEAGQAIILQQAADLKQLDEAKTRFFSNITHEFRTPLTLVLGPLQQVIKRTKDTFVKQKLVGVFNNAQSILRLINQLLDISKLEGGKMSVELSQGNIIKYTKQLVKGFEPLAEKKGQELIFLSKQEDWDIPFDKDKWDKIIYNLLYNAIKFTRKDGVIQLSLSKIQKQGSPWIYFRISDTGIGIGADQITHIFNRFYQIDGSATRKEDGTGIGLSLVKELVELQGGEIWVLSKVDKGTTFEIQLPLLEQKASITTKHSSDNKALFFPVINEYSINQVPKQTNQKEKLHLLLIDDHEELLNYVHSCIDSKKYMVTTAINGQEGIDKAQALIPDLIISDVMMPLKNGFEVTQTIRTHTATSHIPIILLTAKTALESRLEGLKRGADAYLTKPFSPEELSLRVDKLIEIRQILQDRYTNSTTITTSNTSIPKEIFEMEDIFISQLKKFIYSNIDNPALNGDMIGAYFRISRMQLHRKIKALTNQSTSQFIQDIRFELAIDLLQQKKWNVSEIAYQVGFSNPSRFSKVFKKKYGKTPSSMLK